MHSSVRRYTATFPPSPSLFLPLALAAAMTVNAALAVGAQETNTSGWIDFVDVEEEMLVPPFRFYLSSADLLQVGPRGGNAAAVLVLANDKVFQCFLLLTSQDALTPSDTPGEGFFQVLRAADQGGLIGYIAGHLLAPGDSVSVKVMHPSSLRNGGRQGHDDAHELWLVDDIELLGIDSEPRQVRDYAVQPSSLAITGMCLTRDELEFVQRLPSRELAALGELIGAQCLPDAGAPSAGWASAVTRSLRCLPRASMLTVRAALAELGQAQPPHLSACGSQRERVLQE